MKTRERIVETASKLFYEQGYNSTGINQVIKEAGIAKASLYAHFSSKEELLKEYLENTAITTNQVLKQITNDEQTAKDKVLCYQKPNMLHFWQVGMLQKWQQAMS